MEEGSFRDGSELRLEGLSGLKKVVIGSGCFSEASGRCVIANCGVLSEVSVGNGAFAEYRALEVSGLSGLEVLRIGSGCFRNAEALRLEALSGLKRVEIGSGSFSEKSGVLSLRECERVEALTIGDGSFSAFTSFEVEGVPLLGELSVGSECFRGVSELKLEALSGLKKVEIGSDSFTSKEGDFSLRNCSSVSELRVGGGSMRLFRSVAIADVPSLKEIDIGSDCFESVSELGLIGLSGLESVVIGENSLANKEGDFTLKNCSRMSELHVGSGSLASFKTLEIADVPSLRTVEIGDNCFENANALRLMGLAELTRVLIGRNSLASKEGDFYLQNCASVRELRVGSGSMQFFKTVSIEATPLLETVEIGDGCLRYVSEVLINGLPSLKRVVVGSSSFTERSGVFSLKNCSSLVDVSIGNYSFAQYSSLVIDSDPLLREVVIRSNSFLNANELNLSGLDGLEKVVVEENSFANGEGDFYLKNCSSVVSLHVGAGSMKAFKRIEVISVPSLEVMEIGSSSFSNVNELRLIGLPKLRRVMIGSNSFTQHKNGFGSDPNRHFYLKNCPLLTRVGIGRYSFSDFSVCVIENVDSLEVLEIGELNELSFNFHSASLELSGLFGLREVMIGKESFEECDCVVMENMSELRSIRLGWNAMRFNVNNNDSSLIVRNLTELRSLTTVIESVVNDCFGYPHHIVLENLPLLSTVTLERAFHYTNDIRVISSS